MTQCGSHGFHETLNRIGNVKAVACQMLNRWYSAEAMAFIRLWLGLVMLKLWLMLWCQNLLKKY